MSHDQTEIKNLFEPRSVAVIGASHNSAKIGYKVLENIVRGGFGGKVYPINPKGGEILGVSVKKGWDEIEGSVDVACTCVPSKFAFEAVKAAADHGTKFNLVITSGFSEVGNIEEEKRLTAYATDHGMRILGPNIFGMYSAAASVDATFGPGGIKAGSVAIITQSGALGLAMIGKTAVENIGISALVSVGNKADIDEADLLSYLVDDPNTRSILMYIEGVRDGHHLVEVLTEVTPKKPVVVIKSGRSARGAMAAASHTGSLAGSDAVFDAIMRQCGVLRAESIEEAFNLCKFLSDTSVPRGENTVIVTNGGGIGVLATDACEKYNVKLFDDHEQLHEVFSKATPDFGSTKNPIDLTGGATSADYWEALKAARDHERIDSVLALYCETAVFDADNLKAMIRENSEQFKQAGKPLLFSVFGGAMSEEAVGSLTKERVPVFGDVYETVACLGGLYSYYRHLKDRSETVDEAEIDVAAIEEVIQGARADRRGFLLAHEGQRLMDAAGIALPASTVARTIDEAVAFAEKAGYPVVLKIVSRDILHKSDAGGVALDLENRDEVVDAYQAIMRSCRERVPDARITGIEVSEMVRAGVELIVGARRDASFGPIVMFGLGGIYVEVMKDVTFRAVPLNRAEAIEMMKEIRAYPLLLGVRGEERKDIPCVVDTIIRLATIIRKCEGISDIEVNPLVVYEQGQGARAVDVRVMLSSAEGGRSHA
ncbi:acetate--CoA ligase family protein [Candidatus Eisenbacteria bacterium]|uniref:Acetate--CoA ligase family protein n=1 Tax=Eiseniibacteriota bacterium TaxID=2212470 RepID=A0ABV6YI53_UNCEI